MSDDLTVMGIAATAAAAMGREQIVLAHQAEHPLAGNPDVATDPKPSPDLDASIRDDAFAAAARRAGRKNEERAKAAQPAASPVPGEVAALISAAPKGRRSRRAFHLHGSPIRFMALSSSACTGSPLRCLSEASIPPIAFSRHCSKDLYGATGSSRKSRRTTSRLRATVHRWPSPSGPAGKAWPGENVDEPSSPAFTTGPSTATFFSKLSVMFRSSLDTSIKPILCPRKSGPTHICEKIMS